MRHVQRVLITCIIIATSTLVSCYESEYFDEDLTLTSLPDGKLLAHFEFATHIQALTAPGAPLLDYSLFPKAIGQVLQEYHVREMHLTFTQGRWNYDEWGYPPSQSTGTGVELWAWMTPSESIDARWRSLTNTLSGLFCASLNFIDDTLTTEPRLSFRSGHASVPLESNIFAPQQLRYGALPHENVCTENLTPWIKLLPCKAKSGIAMLLNAHKIYSSSFHSMAIHAKSVCIDKECSQRVFELKQTVTSVMDPVRETGRRDWSLSRIFDRTIERACPIARQSRVHVTKEDQNTSLQVQPKPDTALNGKVVYDLHQMVEDRLDIQMSWGEQDFHYPLTLSPPMINAHRYFTGYGQERGGLRITIHNNDKDKSIPVIYFDSLPWFLKLYLHTLKVEVLGHNNSDIIQQMYYQPAKDRSRPTMLECQLLLPPQSVVTVSVEFDKVFLKYTEHRPDANRGFDVGSAVITVLTDDDGSSADQNQALQTIRIYTDTLLVSLPTPDFSMPYNVITLTCTVIALFFGSLFNLLIRTFSVVEADEKSMKEPKVRIQSGKE